MHIDFTPEQKALRQEIRSYYRELFTPELRAAMDAEWEEMVAALGQYQAQHGDCNVPQRWSENPGLAIWLFGQRGKWRRGHLRKDRRQRLEALGVSPELKRSERKMSTSGRRKKK